MKIEIKKLPKSRIEMDIEVPAKEWHKYLNLAAKQLAQDLAVPGFRKGQAPRDIVERELGKGKVLSEAAQLCCQKTYVQALIDKKIVAISPPKITVLKMAEDNPFCYKVEVAVLPEVKLPDYKKMAKQTKRKKVTVKHREIEGAINYLRKSRAKFITLTQPAQKGDAVKIDLSVGLLPERGRSPSRRPKTDLSQNSSLRQAQGINFDKSAKDVLVIIGETDLLPGLGTQLVGMSEGQEKECDLKMPQSTVSKNNRLQPTADRPQGEKSLPQRIKVKIKMKLVQKVVLPEASDEFAKSLGKFSSLQDLEKSLQEGILMEKQIKENERWRLVLINRIASQASMELPEILITQEQDKMMREFKASLKDLGLPFKDYLVKLKKTERGLRQSFLEKAQKRTRVGLCLGEIARQEKINISEKEVEQEINKFLSRYQDMEQARKDIDLEAFHVYTKGVLENEKVFRILEKTSGL